jgi:hypothetical protein
MHRNIYYVMLHAVHIIFVSNFKLIVDRDRDRDHEIAPRRSIEYIQLITSLRLLNPTPLAYDSPKSTSVFT